MASYSETLNYLFNLRGGEIDLRLHRVERALDLFDRPERRYPAFHIAGTNGKGSTAAMLHSILSTQGYRVGLYTSPHVVSFTERIRAGDEEISQEEVVELTGLIRDRIAAASVPLTFFEFITVMAFIYFAGRRVDLAVVEVGLGGRLDATNLVLPKVSVITTISVDHEAYLGSDLLSIAGEKGGIIKDRVPLVCGSLAPEVSELLKGMADAKGSRSYFSGKDFFVELKEGGLFDYRGMEWNLKDLPLALRGSFQRGNACIALGALEVAARDFPVNEAAIRTGLAKVFWPGRLEVISEDPTVILDGAHNGEGVRTLVNEIRALQGDKKVKLLFGAMSDKDWPLMLRELAAVAEEVVLTRVPMERSAAPREMAKVIQGVTPVTIIEDPAEAALALLKRVEPRGAMLVTGSLYLLGQVRPLLVSLGLGRSRLGDSRL